MQLQNLHDLFVEQLQDLYSAEQQLVAALPKMANASSHEELRDAFEHHLRRRAGTSSGSRRSSRRSTSHPAARSARAWKA